MSVDCWSKELYYLIIGDFFITLGKPINQLLHNYSMVKKNGDLSRCSSEDSDPASRFDLDFMVIYLGCH